MDRVAFGHRLTRGYGLRNDPRGSDKKQVRMATSVESVAFAGMYDAHAADLLRYLWRRCGDCAQAEDLLSVVFLEAWRRRAALRPGAATRPWLYGIATNVLRNHRRSLRRHRAALERIAAAAPTCAPAADEQAAIQARLADALDALRRLPGASRMSSRSASGRS
jgi:RNA polymerase sigma factor (sigma-70 family)